MNPYHIIHVILVASTKSNPHLEFFHSTVQLDARPQGRVIRIATLSGDAVVGREARPTGAISHDLRGLNLLAQQ